MYKNKNFIIHQLAVYYTISYSALRLKLFNKYLSILNNMQIFCFFLKYFLMYNMYSIDSNVHIFYANQRMYIGAYVHFTNLCYVCTHL